MFPSIPVSLHKNPGVLQSTSASDKKGAAMCRLLCAGGLPREEDPRPQLQWGSTPSSQPFCQAGSTFKKETERRVCLQVWEVKQLLPGLQGGQASSHWEMHVHVDYEVGQCLGNEAVTPTK